MHRWDLFVFNVFLYLNLCGKNCFLKKLVGQNVRQTFVFVGQFLRWVGQCLMSDRYFKHWVFIILQLRRNVNKPTRHTEHSANSTGLFFVYVMLYMLLFIMLELRQIVSQPIWHTLNFQPAQLECFFCLSSFNYVAIFNLDLII